MKKYEDHPVLTMGAGAVTLILILFGVSQIIVARSPNVTPKSTPTATATSTAIFTATNTPTNTPTYRPTRTPRNTPTPRPTQTQAAPTKTPILTIKKVAHATATVGKPRTSPSTNYVPNGDVIRVLRYNYGRMEQVLRIHETFSYGGDYVPGLYTRHDVDGLTAVNFASRGLLRRSAVVIAKLYDPKYKIWVTQRLQASDWQMQRDATAAQRLEVDGNTAARLHFYADGTTRAVVIAYENG